MSPQIQLKQHHNGGSLLFTPVYDQKYAESLQRKHQFRLSITSGHTQSASPPTPGQRPPLETRRPHRTETAHHAAPALLTCDVPELQPHQGLAVPVEDFEGEVHADRGPIVLREKLVDVALDNARLAHAEFADDQDLEQMLPALGHPRGGAGASPLPASHSPAAQPLRRPRRSTAAAHSPAWRCDCCSPENFLCPTSARDWSPAAGAGSSRGEKNHLTGVTGRGNSTSYKIPAREGRGRRRARPSPAQPGSVAGASLLVPGARAKDAQLS